MPGRHPKALSPLELREAMDWSQARMAEYLGCDQSTVSRIERGSRIPGPISRLLVHLQRDVDLSKRTKRRSPTPEREEA